VVCGYRLRELLSVGESANVYAGSLDAGVSSSLGAGAGAASVAKGRSGAFGDVVTVKVCLDVEAPGSDSEGCARDRECRALALRPIARMPRLLDVGTTERGELVLVMTPCPGVPLHSTGAQWEGLRLDGGALENLVTTLHEAGVAHGGLDPGAVLIDDDGSPSLVGFGSARFAGERGFDAAVGADLRALASLVRRPTAGQALTRPFFVGDPTSLRDDDGEDAAWRWNDGLDEEAPAGQLAFLDTLEPAVLAIRESGAALRGLVHTRSAVALGSRRRRLLAMGGGLVVAATVVGCLVIPSGSPSTPDARPAGAPEPAAGAISSVAPLAGTPPATRESSGQEGAVATAGSPGATAALDVADDIRSDGVIRATAALLAARRVCLATQAAGCLDGVDQWNSPAMLADRELSRANAETDDPIATATAPVLVERIGATALLTATIGGGGSVDGAEKPVSLLVMRNETGWRLRSYRVGPGTP
jgi:hypothetical protein